MPSKTKEKATAYNVWLDPSAPDQEFEHAAFMKHLKEVHGIDSKTTKGTRRTLSHCDGDTWFSWSYEWEIGGKKFTQHTCYLRTGDNLAMWSHGDFI
jgi:hypothetical protein